MSSKKQETTQRMEPWSDAQPALRDAVSGAQSLYEQGGFATTPYTGDMIAGFGDTSTMGQNAIVDQAMLGGQGIQEAQGTLSQYMQGVENPALEAAKNNAMGGAIPSVMAQFAGGGMANSSAAVDTATRAAVDAIAPYEYGAMESASNRALQAASMAPTLEAASYIPGQMLSGVGAQQDAMAQAEIDASMQQHYQTANQELENLQGYTNMAALLGGMGGTNTATQPGQSFGQQAGGSLLGGLGTYGALAANPVTAPFALLGGVGSGLLGLL